MAENPDAPEPTPPPTPLVSTPLVRRTNAPDPPALPPDIEEQFNQLARTVQVLSAHFLGESDAASAEAAKDRGARRVRKFHRAGGDESPPESTPDKVGDVAEEPGETPSGFERNKQVAWPRSAPTPRFTPAAWQPSPETRWRLGALLLGGALLGLGFAIGHATSPPTAARDGSARRNADELFGPSELTEQAFLTANEALHAEHGGNADAARRLYESALNRHVELPGMNYRLALLALQRNDRLEAEQRLERSSLDGEKVAECGYVLARMAADQNDFDEAATQFQRAIRVHPFEGKYFFYYGEILRRQGKPQAAITAFEQALERPYAAADGDLYLFKEQLAKVEYGRDDAFNAELANRLKEPVVGGDWLLLAAAHDLDRQSFTAAAEHLRQAETRLPSAVYAVLSHDYVFQAQAKRSELGGLLDRNVSPVISAAGPTVLDPASWPPERADPAAWPFANGRPAH